MAGNLELGHEGAMGTYVIVKVRWPTALTVHHVVSVVQCPLTGAGIDGNSTGHKLLEAVSLAFCQHPKIGVRNRSQKHAGSRRN
jgi:hypothetical protein